MGGFRDEDVGVCGVELWACRAWGARRSLRVLLKGFRVRVW